MKINWGTGIAIFYTFFVGIMVFMVIKSTYHKSHLVVEDYYQKDLDYEAFRKKRQNASLPANQVTIKYLSEEKNLQLNFPKTDQEVSGEVLLFRPSNKYLDQTHAVQLDQNAEMRLPVPQPLSPGLWKVKIDWERAGESYYTEQSIVF